MSYDMLSEQTVYSRLSDPELLQKLIGIQQTRKLYQGSLSTVFSGSHNTVPEKCAVARELIQRWLDEELRRECVLNAPAAILTGR